MLLVLHKFNAKKDVIKCFKESVLSMIQRREKEARADRLHLYIRKRIVFNHFMDFANLKVRKLQGMRQVNEYIFQKNRKRVLDSFRRNLYSVRLKEINQRKVI